MLNSDILYNLVADQVHKVLQPLNNLAINNFGYREFNKNGTSIGFCTHGDWNKIQKESNFVENMSAHYQQELLNLKSNDFKYLVRSGDGAKSSFLQSLCLHHLWNSLVIYRKDKDKIYGYYFISSSENTNIINFYLNKLHIFDNIVSILAPNMRSASQDPVNKDLHMNILNTNTMKDIFEEKTLSIPLNRSQGISLKYLDEKFYLTNREVEIILLITSNYSYKEIGAKLKISSRTVESHLLNIKMKTGKNNKCSLTSFVRETKLYKIHGNIL